jgi:hypothetical protein
MKIDHEILYYMFCIQHHNNRQIKDMTFYSTYIFRPAENLHHNTKPYFFKPREKNEKDNYNG